MPGDDGYGVLLINRQVARILAGGADGMREVISFVDDVHRWHDQGGWSQSRFQRGIAEGDEGPPQARRTTSCSSSSSAAWCSG